MQMLQDIQSSKHAHANMNRNIFLQALMPTLGDPQPSTTVSISLGFKVKLPYDHNDPPAQTIGTFASKCIAVISRMVQIRNIFIP
jgi:hypothetical protein